MALSCAIRDSGWVLGKSLLIQSSKAVAQAAKGGDAVAVPGGVQEPCRGGTEGFGQWAQWDGSKVRLGGLISLFQTMIL